MSLSMPKSCRTDTFMSGIAGEAGGFWGAVAIATPWPRNGAGPRFLAGIRYEWANLAEGGALRKPLFAWLECRYAGAIVEERRDGLCCAQGARRPDQGRPPKEAP